MHLSNRDRQQYSPIAGHMSIAQGSRPENSVGIEHDRRSGPTPVARAITDTKRVIRSLQEAAIAEKRPVKALGTFTTAKFRRHSKL